MAHQATAHDRLRASLDLAGLELRASEVHGLVCGDICRQRRHGYDSDVASLVGVAAAASGEQAALLDAIRELRGHSLRALDAGEQFSLLLPNDDEPMAGRTDSLADWARGFALGLLRGKRLSLDGLGGASTEVVRDMLEISEAQPGEDTEQDERAFTEIEEYMRVGVQLVFEELQPGHDDEPNNRGNTLNA